MIVKNIRLQRNEQEETEIVLTSQHHTNIQEYKDIIAKGKLLDVSIKQCRFRRSNDANSYAWVLITKIADALRADKQGVYIQMLERYGQREKNLLSVVSEAVDMIYTATNNHCTTIGTSVLNGKEFTHLAILRGSSTYDSNEMAILVDGIVSEAKELGIETLTPKELSLLINEWERRKM